MLKRGNVKYFMKDAWEIEDTRDVRNNANKVVAESLQLEWPMSLTK